MGEKKTIGISALISAAFITMVMITPGFFDEPKYFCESRPDLGLFECDAFSKYVDPNGRCINATQEDITYSSKICRTGWMIVTNDMVIPEEEPIIHAYPEWERQPRSIECFVNDSCIYHY